MRSSVPCSLPPGQPLSAAPRPHDRSISSSDCLQPEHAEPRSKKHVRPGRQADGVGADNADPKPASAATKLRTCRSGRLPPLGAAALARCQRCGGRTAVGCDCRPGSDRPREVPRILRIQWIGRASRRGRWWSRQRRRGSQRARQGAAAWPSAREGRGLELTWDGQCQLLCNQHGGGGGRGRQAAVWADLQEPSAYLLPASRPRHSQQLVEANSRAASLRRQQARRDATPYQMRSEPRPCSHVHGRIKSGQKAATER